MTRQTCKHNRGEVSMEEQVHYTEALPLDAAREKLLFQCKYTLDIVQWQHWYKCRYGQLRILAYCLIGLTFLSLLNDFKHAGYVPWKEVLSIDAGLLVFLLWSNQGVPRICLKRYQSRVGNEIPSTIVRFYQSHFEIEMQQRTRSIQYHEVKIVERCKDYFFLRLYTKEQVFLPRSSFEESKDTEFLAFILSVTTGKQRIL